MNKNCSTNHWKVDYNYDYKQHFGKNVRLSLYGEPLCYKYSECISNNTNITSQKYSIVEGIFLDILFKGNDFDKNTVMLDIKKRQLNKKCECRFKFYPKFLFQKEHTIAKFEIDDSKYLHKKYILCKSKLLERLPEEIVKKHIFKFLQENYIVL